MNSPEVRDAVSAAAGPDRVALQPCFHSPPLLFTLSDEGLLRTCLNLAHRAAVELKLPVPPERRQLPAVLAEAGVVSRRAASFSIEAVEILTDRHAGLPARRCLHRGLHLLADYALQVEEALAGTVRGVAWR